MTEDRPMFRSRDKRRIAAALSLGAMFLLLALLASAETFTIDTRGGAVELDISHVGPSGSLVLPGAPTTPGFRPPSVFSPPLPSGSGARALGIAGAFTAVADDATAASWNPAGLTQLQRPEASYVLRYSRTSDAHTSSATDFSAGDDSFDDYSLNYFSTAVPFSLWGRNFVFSANYQEAYDFEQRVTARFTSATHSIVHTSNSATYDDTRVDHVASGNVELYVTSHLTTRVTSQLDQILNSATAGGIDFDQQGLIDAFTPALAMELTPRLSVGAAINVYGEGMLGQGPIRSRTTASYSGNSDSFVNILDQRTTSGSYTYTGTWHVPALVVRQGFVLPATNVPIASSGTYSTFSDETRSTRTDSLTYEGVYSEENRFDSLHGLNATLGTRMTVSRHLSLGLTADLPWTAHAQQTKTVVNAVTTYDGSRTRVLAVSQSSSTVTKDVDIDFPLYWAAGMVWKWTTALWSSLDVSETQWSRFSYRAEGEGRLNPLDGTPYGEHPVDDCWAVRCGTEYLWMMQKTEIPFRLGFSWEQRPAMGQPDVFYGVSAGTGVSIGKDPGKVVVDITYRYAWGNDVYGSLVPDQQGLSTDVREHQVFVSNIWHF